ncbi:MAG TPA: glycosyltransferase family 39 protein [Thermoanaerobaculia bacterium]|nr:glycosyltransferase family 39 protein [Thermoanaerobaculia bacterium]
MSDLTGGAPSRRSSFFLPVAWPVILAVAAVKFALQFYASGYYHYFRDELYFIACGRHLAWGYVDHAPLIALYARIGEMLGPSLRGFRLLSTLFGTLQVILTGIITARLGGNRIAQALACIVVFLTPVNLGIDSILSMNSAEHVIWLACLLVLIEIVNTGNEKLWLLFGLCAGIGLENKHSMLFLGFAITVAVVLTPLRRSLLKPWIYAGGALAVLIFLPNLIWQYQHHFPTLELLHNVKVSGKNVVLGPFAFIVQQAMMLNPFSAPLCLLGLGALFFHRDLKRYRVLGWTYVVLLATFIKFEAKDYYVAPIYPVLFAAGSVAVAQWLANRRALLGLVFIFIIATGLIPIPQALPILPPEGMLAYMHRLGIKPHATERSHTAALPQLFADQFGWEELTQDVAKVYNALPPAQRAKTVIYCGNYGEAGAIDFYGPKYGLPHAISGHQNYFYWGTHGATGDSVILVGDDPEADMWMSLKPVAKHYHPLGMPFENSRPIYLGIGLKKPLSEVWPSVKFWY